MIEPVVLGDCTLYLGDCLEVLPTLEAGSVDAVVTDPPYGLQENAHRIASRSKLAATIDYGDFEWDADPASQEEIDAIQSIGKEHIIWGGNYFCLPPSRGWLVWDKLNSGNFADAELAWTDLKMSVRIFRHLWNGMIRGSERGIRRVHPTQKPIALMKWCLSFLDNGLVCDPMMGSGTTGVACVQTGRKFIGVEIEPKYFDIAVKRISEAQLQMRMAI